MRSCNDDLVIMSDICLPSRSHDVCSILLNNDYAKSVTVPEAKQHQDGYTIYKIILQAIRVKRTIEEDPLIFVAWKRFRDLHKLHRRVVVVHAQLYLKGTVPLFPQPDFFGRLEPSVVEERRQASEQFLSFVVQNSVLCQCEALLVFFSGAEYPKPVITADIVGARASETIPSQPPLEPLAASSLNSSPRKLQTGRSVSESSDMSDDFSPQRVAGSSDLSVFDPFPATSQRASASNYQMLAEALSDIQVSTSNTSEEPSRVPNDEESNRTTGSSSGRDGASVVSSHTKKSSVAATEEAICERRDNDCEHNSTVPKWRSKIADFFPRLSPSSSKQFDEANDPKFKSSGELKSVMSDGQLCSNNIGRRASKRGGSPTAAQIAIARQSTLDYVLQAAEFISSAQKAEEENAFDLAFTCYKSAVMLLLQGVQDEKDLNRRNAARLKTAKYLKKAEKLYRNYVATDTNSSFCMDGFTSRFLSNFGIMGFQSVHSELAQYKVLRILGEKVQLVQDTTSGEKYVVKFLYKSCYNSSYSPTKILDQCVPTRVPHMVKLVKFWDTETAVILLLEYAAGGRLWQRLRSYFERARPMFRCYFEKKLTADAKDGCDWQRRSESADNLPAKSNSIFGATRRNRSGSDPSDLQLRKDRSISAEEASLDDDENGALQFYGKDVDTSLFGVYEQKSRSKRFSTEDSFSIGTLPSPVVATSGRRFSLLYSESHAGPDGCNLNDPVEEFLIRKWIAQLTIALGHLHGEGVLCRTLNPDNLLLNDRDDILLTFFCEWSGIDRPFNTHAAGMLYSAPEVDGTIWEPLTDAIDWWSLGVIIYEMVTGMSLHSQCPHGIGPNTTIPLPDYLSVELRDLMTRLIRFDSEDRLGSCFGGVDEIKMHPFFIDFDWQTVEPS